jgi:nucleoid-associated protein YgaU
MIAYVLVVPGGDRHGTQLVVPPDAVSIPVAEADNSTPAPTESTTAAPTALQPTAAAAAQPATPAVASTPAPDHTDRWAIALETGQVPTLMTQTPAPSPSRPVDLAVAPPAPRAEPRLADLTAAPVAVVSSTPPAATQPTGSRTHKVQKGETLSSIAAAVYGNRNLYTRIQQANPQLDAHKLRPGMIINLPDISTATTPESTASHATPTLTESSTTYRVQPGDSLHRIAQKLYGRPEMAQKIYDLNKDSIGSDPGKLKLNMVLKLPETPTAPVVR